MTNLPKDQVEAIAAALKNKDDIVVTAKQQSQGKTIGLTFIIIFIMNLLGIMKSVGNKFEAKVANSGCEANFPRKIALVLIAARITIQSSRIQALLWAKEEDKILDLLKFTNDEKDKLNNKTIYLGLDYIQENQIKIEDKLFKAYYGNNPPKRLFYDVTSSYVTGDYSDSELVAYGYNRDRKKGTQQIVIGLLTDENGHAISIHTYPGNTNDISTFTDQLDKLKNRFNLDSITIVGDGGMIKSEDIIKVKKLGYDYITSIGKPSIQKLIDNKDSQIQLSLFDEDLQEVIENDTRYIVRQNPIRRDEIRQTRESKITRLKEFIDMKVEYHNTHYRAKQETVQKHINKKISDLKLSKFISYEITYKEENITIKNKKGEEEIKSKDMASIEIIIDTKAKIQVEQLDGCYVVTTSLTDTSKDTKEEIHKAYKTLIKVENAFKTLKTEFLEIRPLYLKTDKRIKGHVALSMLAYNITLKLKSYTNQAKLNFKDTIRKLSTVKTVINTINSAIKFETIPFICEDLIKLFDQMKFKLPTKI